MKQLTDVVITLDGETLPFAEAIETGRITPEEIICFARMDTAKGYCKESFSSEKGLASFRYCYPYYEINYIYDVLETPIYGQHLITNMIICQPGGNTGTSTVYILDEPEGLDPHVKLTREDWGLTFQPVECTPTQLKLSCEHMGNQHIGTLKVTMYMLYSVTEEKQLRLTEGDYVDASLGDNDVELAPQAVTEFVLDLTPFGTVPPGEYILTVYVEDFYTPEQVHPLMVNYADSQRYMLEITIP